MEQENINRNLHERLGAIEVHEQVFIAMMVSLIKTHPHPEIVQKLFDAHIEAFRARLLGEPIPDEVLDELDELHSLLQKAFELSTAKIKDIDFR